MIPAKTYNYFAKYNNYPFWNAYVLSGETYDLSVLRLKYRVHKVFFSSTSGPLLLNGLVSKSFL